MTWPRDPNYSGFYTVQTSPDLVIWTNVASTVVGKNGALAEDVVVTINRESNVRLFARFKSVK